MTQDATTVGGGRRLSLHFDFLPEARELWTGSSLAVRTLLSACSDAFCQQGPGGEPVFPLVRTYALADSGRVFRFQLLETARFHDGDPVTAKDVLHSIERKLGALRTREGVEALVRRNPIRGLRRVTKTKFEIQCDPQAGDLVSFLAELAIPIVKEGSDERAPTFSGLYRVVRWSPSRIDIAVSREHVDWSESLWPQVSLLPVKDGDTLSSLLHRPESCVAARTLAFWCSHEVDASRVLRFQAPAGQAFLVALARHAASHVHALREALSHLPGDKFVTFQSRWLEPLAGFFPEGHPLAVNVDSHTLAQAHSSIAPASAEPLVVAVEEGLIPQAVLQEWQWFLSQMGTELAFKVCQKGTALELLSSSRVDGVLLQMDVAESGPLRAAEEVLEPLLPLVSAQAGELASLLRQARAHVRDRGRALQAVRNFLRALVLKSSLLPACFVPEVVLLGLGVRATGRMQPACGIDLRYLRERPVEVNEESLRRTKLEAIMATTQMFAHDVRKPFSLLRMAMDLMLRAENISEARTITERLLPEVDKAIDNVNVMIEDLMEVGVARTLHVRPTDARALVRSTLVEVFAAAKAADVAFDFDFDALPPLLVDAGRLQRVLSNILTNAVQAMSGRGCVWVHGYPPTREEPRATIVLGNSGSYIDPDELPRIFEAFYTRGKRGGTGLGLAIVEKIVREHGGAIHCRSTPGSEQTPPSVEFLLSLPVAEPGEGTPEGTGESALPLPTHSSQISDALAPKPRSAQEPSSLEAEARKLEEAIARNLAHTEPFRILVVDDEDLYRDALSLIVGRSEKLRDVVEIEGVKDEATLRARIDESLCERAWDLVICDIDLGPDSADGFTLVRLMRSLGLRADVCVHSNRTGIENYRRALEEGADVFLPKPMSRLHLLKLLEDTSRKRVRKDVRRATKPRGIAVVDDNFIVLHAWKKHHAQGSQQVHVFSSPRAFWSSVGDGLLDPGSLLCIVTDHYFEDGEGDGIDFLTLVEERYGLPVLLQTNAEFDEDLRTHLGARLIEKRPHSFEELEALVASWQK